MKSFAILSLLAVALLAVGPETGSAQVSSFFGTSLKDIGCESGYALSGTFDPARKGPYCISKEKSLPGLSHNIGGLFEDGACASGHAVAGTFNPATKKPFCAPNHKAGLLGGAQDDNAKQPASVGALIIDEECESGHALAGTFDSSRMAPYCAEASKSQEGTIVGAVAHNSNCNSGSGMSQAGSWDASKGTPNCLPGVTHGGLLGGAMRDESCGSGMALAGTYDPKRGGPFCVAGSKPDCLSAASNCLKDVEGFHGFHGLFSNSIPATSQDQERERLGAVVEDATCESGRAQGGTWDASANRGKGGPYCIPLETGSQSLLGAVFIDADCPAKLAVAGTLDPTRNPPGPYCSDAPEGPLPPGAEVWGGEVEDPECPLKKAYAGTVDPSRGGAPYCTVKALGAIRPPSAGPAPGDDNSAADNGFAITMGVACSVIGCIALAGGLYLRHRTRLPPHRLVLGDFEDEFGAELANVAEGPSGMYVAPRLVDDSGEPTNNV